MKELSLYEKIKNELEFLKEIGIDTITFNNVIYNLLPKIDILEKENEEMKRLIYDIRDNQYEPEKIEIFLIRFFDKKIKGAKNV